jgi:ATP-binding cassette subfamily B protein RaxB
MPDGEWAVPYLRMGGVSGLPVIRQDTASECGLACVAMVASYLGVGADLVELRKKNKLSLNGLTLKGIAAICDRLRLSSRAVRCRVDELSRLRTPCLLHWRLNHFVVLKRVSRRHLVLHDPARGVVRETYAQAFDDFTGVALEISPGPEFRKTKPPPRLRLSALLPGDAALLRSLSVGVLLAFICELLFLASPFYLQIIIDEVLGKSDTLLLDTVAIGFSLLLLFQVFASTLRQLTFQYLSQVSVFDISARILDRLLRLPLAYFRDRDLGDVQHRVNALRRVQTFIVHSAPALLLDLLFVVLIICLMTLYDFGLTVLALVVALAWFSWRVALYPVSYRLATAIAHAESSVDTHFLETLRSVQTVKMYRGEAARLSEWRNLFAAGINRKIQAGNLGILDSAIRQLLLQGLRILCIYLLARKALEGQMSVGMVSAFVAYLGMFITRAGGIVDRITEYRLLEVPMERIADIVFAEKSLADHEDSRTTTTSNQVELRHVAFSYSDNEPPVLKDCSCKIAENGFTAIAGCSGAGKSTLLHLIAGVEAASDGEILIGGLALGSWQQRHLRARVASVFQGDCLLKGSVAENIALFDNEWDMDHVRRAARQACIHREIEALPMGYNARIGDLGASLSKGQVQRVLLARAFYREPRLLLLDEVTSGLDAELEQRVVQSIARLDATRIVITHSDRMLTAADDVLWLRNGVLLSSRPELNV